MPPAVAAERERAAKLASMTIWIATDRALEGDDSCVDGPSAMTIARLRCLAGAALGRLDDAARASATELVGAALTGDSGIDAPTAKDASAAAAAATDRALGAAASAVFDAPFHEFDALIELSASKVPSGQPAWRSGKGREGVEAKPAYANMTMGEIGNGVGDDPVGEYVRQLRSMHDSMALYCYDARGGRTVAVKWRPAAFLPAKLSTTNAQNRLLIHRQLPPDASTARTAGAGKALASATWALPNVPAMLCEMREHGGALVKKVSLPKGRRVPL